MKVSKTKNKNKQTQQFMQIGSSSEVYLRKNGLEKELNIVITRDSIIKAFKRMKYWKASGIEVFKRSLKESINIISEPVRTLLNKIDDSKRVPRYMYNTFKWPKETVYIDSEWQNKMMDGTEW